MSIDQVFTWANQLAALGWLILIVLPRRFEALNWLPRYVIPFALCLLYAGAIMPHIYTIDGGGFGSMDQVRTLFAHDHVLLAGWVHYLAFDLFVGAWVAAKADEIGLSRLIQAPILAATFMFGPVGLALFLTVRSFYRPARTPA